jgi:hypothetical protein
MRVSIEKPYVVKGLEPSYHVHAGRRVCRSAASTGRAASPHGDTLLRCGDGLPRTASLGRRRRAASRGLESSARRDRAWADSSDSTTVAVLILGSAKRGHERRDGT